ncbi:hypothetical protein [Thermomonas sp.]|jgi:hypothetical protein|uniref:hypothetical protein n=1 Tax=Thermomonas sp. TaxID=1971895 RepID=UPI001B408A03|nr:hypothetical protein [Thermomonas sp.]MBK6924884.1 hypothetical protein [Thermomonas sp.]MBK7206507.1 hypothetical protein [Thermomonas sp.]MBK9669220.1 hypothetical protein [Thermomonas sp.]MBL0229096.1 hypothetical protein [Thermomonas sp.]MBP6438201.1 hypothetical protein [Thermomonas sp.]
MFRHAIAGLVLASSALVSLAVPAVADAGEPVVAVHDIGNLKGVKRVAVTSFVVQYVVAQQTTSRGGASSGIDLGKDIDPARLQQATEQIYAQFLADLGASGIEVVAPEALAASKGFREMLGKSPATPLAMSTWSRGKDGGYSSVFHVPKGLPMVVRDDYEYLKGRGLGQVTDPSLSIGGGIKLASTNWRYYDKAVQDELQAATLLVRVFVPLAYNESSTSIAGPWQKDSAKTTAGLRIGERFTRMAVVQDDEIAKIYLGEPLLAGDSIIANQGAKSGFTASKLLFGSKNNESFALDADQYFQDVPAASAKVLNAFIKAMNDNR